jgi:hypothetical protein
MSITLTTSTLSTVTKMVSARAARARHVFAQAGLLDTHFALAGRCAR